ncbi:MAG: hypothetical protein AAF357_14365 [Verrucomicrobiota bacterium]
MTPISVLADDHPVAPRGRGGRDLPFLWAKLPEAPFRSLSIQHEKSSNQREYSNRDLFAELIDPCRERGIKVYGRILEAGMRRADRIPGYESVATVDLEGKPGLGPCWNHPEYLEWVRLTIETTMKAYPLDGFQYGAERVGALSDVLFRGIAPACFCDHCDLRNRNAGTDPERAREGYRQLFDLIKRVERTDERPADGMMASVIRVVMRYPEVLSWYRQWFQADSEIQTLVYQTAKRVRPEADVGQHVDHQRSSWDLFYRAAVTYEEMAQQNDFIKPIVYHDIIGPRLKEWVIDRNRERILRDFSEQEALEIFYGLFGHSSASQPDYEGLSHRGLTPEYVFREISRCVAGVGEQAKVYAGIGFDIPHYVPNGMKKFPSDPETTYEATKRAIEAGASGVIASREYSEMTVPNLQAFGRAVREAHGRNDF